VHYLTHCCQPTILNCTACCAVQCKLILSLRCVLSGCTVTSRPSCIRRAQVKVGLIHLCKGLFSLNARIYYSIAHRQVVCNLPGGYSTILHHREVHCSSWFLSDVARWACLEESMARSLTVISLLLQSTTHCRYQVCTKFLPTYTAIYRRNRKVLPLGITVLQPQSRFHLGTPYTI
jgi:hypothetical protein